MSVNTMVKINWLEEVGKRKEQLIEDAQQFLRIKSVLDEETATPTAPFGEGIDQALHYLLKKGRKDGFNTKNVDGFAGHLELGGGKEIVGVLCHIDVVPEGEGWTSAPYSAEIRDGKIFARGSLDDKGPTMAAYYALKIVKELGLPLSKRVRMIIGTDEESNWRCVEHYFKHEEMPTIGFAPDADFPIIFAEKGIANFDLVQTQTFNNMRPEEYSLQSFSSGQRYNMVPEDAIAEIAITDASIMIEQYHQYLTRKQLKGSAFHKRGIVTLHLHGKSAHGMEPKEGINAGVYLANFLQAQNLDSNAAQFVSFVSSYFFEDSRGEKLGVAYSDKVTQDLTINVGKLQYSKENGGKIGINLRYPGTTDMGNTKKKIEHICERNSFEVKNYSDSKPHHVDEDHYLIQTLKKVYEQQTGEEATLLAIGGGTYARSLKNGVAFGPLFPERIDVAHQKDEYIIIDDLVKATAMYAQAIYELAK